MARVKKTKQHTEATQQEHNKTRKTKMKRHGIEQNQQQQRVLPKLTC